MLFIALFYFLNIQGENGKVWYRITSGNVGGAFKINNMTGSISVNRPLDREQIPSYALEIEAADRGFPAPRKVCYFQYNRMLYTAQFRVDVKLLQVASNKQKEQQPIRFWPMK